MKGCSEGGRAKGLFGGYNLEDRVKGSGLPNPKEGREVSGSSDKIICLPKYTFQYNDKNYIN